MSYLSITKHSCLGVAKQLCAALHNSGMPKLKDDYYIHILISYQNFFEGDK